ncbi:MAG: DUF502 domain-containing protein [Planctomycetota bacterium]
MDDVSPPTRGKKKHSSFRKFFGRGLGLLLPTVLTAWLVVIAYQFVDQRIAQPINRLVRFVILEVSDFPEPTDDDFDVMYEELPRDARALWGRIGAGYGPDEEAAKRVQWMRSRDDAGVLARREALRREWEETRVAGFVLADLLGLVLAVVLVYAAGLLLSNLLGRKLYSKGEELINRVPLVGRVYPSVKQVTDFFFGDKESQISFNRVVAVQYPRKGLWSVGLVTGSTMRRIQQEAGAECLTVFVPSSPTPFTGYVITVPVRDTIDLGVSIEDALKFAVSGGVLIPPAQQIDPADAPSSQGVVQGEGQEPVDGGTPADQASTPTDLPPARRPE